MGLLQAGLGMSLKKILNNQGKSKRLSMLQPCNDSIQFLLNELVQ
jgi:hypothetical protein